MNHETIALNCPWKVMSRGDWRCKALADQPNGTYCTALNCAPLHIANMFINDKIGGDHENATSAAAASRRDES